MERGTANSHYSGCETEGSSQGGSCQVRGKVAMGAGDPSLSLEASLLAGAGNHPLAVASETTGCVRRSHQDQDEQLSWLGRRSRAV